MISLGSGILGPLAFQYQQHVHVAYYGGFSACEARNGATARQLL